MSAAILPGRMTVDEFLARPERTDGFDEELVLGEIVVSPNAKPVHNYVASRVMFCLRPLENTGQYLVLGEVACRLTEDSLPNTDACVFQRAAYEQAMASDDYPRVPPVLAIEVASPGNRRMHTKAELYLEQGTEQVWLIYPRSRTVTVLARDEEQYTVREGEALRFAGLSVDPADLFQKHS